MQPTSRVLAGPGADEAARLDEALKQARIGPRREQESPRRDAARSPSTCRDGRRRPQREAGRRDGRRDGSRRRSPPSRSSVEAYHTLADIEQTRGREAGRHRGLAARPEIQSPGRRGRGQADPASGKQATRRRAAPRSAISNKLCNLRPRSRNRDKEARSCWPRESAITRPVSLILPCRSRKRPPRCWTTPWRT